MDKEILAVIGRLYLENMGLFNTVDMLQKKLDQLEHKISIDSSTKETKDS